MAKLTLDTNPLFTTDVEIRESDHYSGLIYLDFTKTYQNSKSNDSDFLLTPTQLELMAQFMLRQANEIRQAQLHRSTKEY
jgi:hypothetical protein